MFVKLNIFKCKVMYITDFLRAKPKPKCVFGIHCLLHYYNESSVATPCVILRCVISPNSLNKHVQAKRASVTFPFLNNFLFPIHFVIDFYKILCKLKFLLYQNSQNLLFNWKVIKERKSYGRTKMCKVWTKPIQASY
jgi:hypothetical protein